MPWECQYILQILWVIVYTWRKVGTERLNGLSLVTQQVSVKYRTWAPFDFCFSPKPLCRGHRSSVPRVPWFRFCVLIYMVSFSTQPWSFQYSRLHLWSPPCSLTSAALMKCAVPNILLYAVESPQMPFQPQLILGVERRTYKKAMGRCSLWTLDKMELDILQLSYIPMFSMENKIKVSRWGNFTWPFPGWSSQDTNWSHIGCQCCRWQSHLLRLDSILRIFFFFFFKKLREMVAPWQSRKIFSKREMLTRGWVVNFLFSSPHYRTFSYLRGPYGEAWVNLLH